MINVAKVVLKNRRSINELESWNCFVELNSYKENEDSKIRLARRA